MNFRTLNYMTWELLDPQLHHMRTSGPSITPHGSEVPMWCNWRSRSSYVVYFRVQKFTGGVIETSGLSITPHGNFWTLNYMTWELLDPQLHHMGTSGPSITPQANFLTLNYTTCELFNHILHHTWTSGPSITPRELLNPQLDHMWEKFMCGLIVGSEIPMWCNWGCRSSHVM
jgi:hypothetical protein